MKKFGDFLTSRAAGREAYLAARAYILPHAQDETLELDFTGVKVLTPSWIDEFFLGLEEKFAQENIQIVPTENLSVTASVQAVRET